MFTQGIFIVSGSILAFTASMALLVRARDFLTRGHAVREVGGSNPGRGTIAGGVFHPTGKIFSTDYPVYCKF